MDAHSSQSSHVGSIVQRFDEAWQQGNIEALMSLVSDDCVYDASVGPGPGTEYAGKAEVRRGFVQMLSYDASGDSKGRLVMVDDVRALMLWTVTNLTSAGTTVAIGGCDVFEVRDGLIRRKDAFRKSLS